MNNAVIIDCVRTPVGRAHPEKGFYRHTRSEDLAVHCIRALVERTGIDPKHVEDLVIGNTQQTMEQGLNISRIIGLMAGLPVEAAGTTVNRLCGSSLQALNQGAHAIMCGFEDVHIVGGVEHMQHLPMDHGIDINPKLFQQTSKGALHMGITAEFLSQMQEISREQQDEFALRSHQRAAVTQRNGLFEREIIPTHAYDEAGHRFLANYDQCVRPESSLESLAALQPAFVPKTGTITAGNSSPLNDGAAAMLMMSESKAKQLGLKPLVRVKATAVAGVEPSVMGTGPVPATKKALQRAGLELKDIDLIELNEAFAAQALACIKMLGADIEKVNTRGGAIAIGHPLGASGARISTTLIHNMIDSGAKYGLATMCIGLGQGIATIFERVS